MKNMHYSQLTLTAIEAALQAGDILKQGFGTSYEVIAKPGRQNFVTKYDKASEAFIISMIRKQFPAHHFLAEESGLTKESDAEEILWIIDPLDGTTNFAHHIPLFTISIAAYDNDKGLCGVVYQPMTNELFVAERSKGAYYYTPFDSDWRAQGKRIRVSQTVDFGKAFVIAGIPCEDGHAQAMLPIDKLIQIQKQGATMRNFGSAALALAYIAAGKADAAWIYHLYPWDFAAGQLLIEEAGGKFYRCNYACTSHSPADIVASNSGLASKLLPISA